MLSLKLLSFPFSIFLCVADVNTHTHTLSLSLSLSLSLCPHFLKTYILGHQYLYSLCRVSAGSIVNLYAMTDIGSEDDNMIGWIFSCDLYAARNFASE